MNTASMRSTLRVAALAIATAALLGSIAPAPADAALVGSKLTRIRINTTMALPGVVLPPGTYTFQLANSLSSADTVVVRSDRPMRQPVFLGLTHRVARPRHMRPDQVIVIGEAAAGDPAPITAWYPDTRGSGYRFVY